jgi:hypothetical protein
MDRYTWEDLLTDAQTAGVIPEGAWALAMKLSRAVNWSPKDGRPSGLYLANVQAAESVGSSRATLYRYEALLIEAGFFTLAGGNLLATLPHESQIETIQAGAKAVVEVAKARQAEKKAKKSQVETTESHIETDSSQVETEESQVEHPLSEDILTADEFSEDSVSADAVPAAQPPFASLTSDSPSSEDDGVGTTPYLDEIEDEELEEVVWEWTEEAVRHELTKRGWRRDDVNRVISTWRYEYRTVDLTADELEIKLKEALVSGSW